MDGRIVRKKTAFSNEINQNLGYLTENLTSLRKILIHLIEHGIISNDERQLINSKKTDLGKNDRLLSLIQKKNWPERKNSFLQILRNTGNGHCADAIEKTAVNNLKPRCESWSKWWPEEKTLPKAFLERKSENCLLIDTLKNILSRNASEGIAVITQQLTVSGLGGIGKTTTAIWFAQQYQSSYERILWIDCGEKSLLQSFKKLARFLKLEDRHELDLNELAAGSYHILKDVKCLLIFDNAECYIGNAGIKDVLPKSIENFDVLITSRNQRWGDANGDGEITQFRMNVFHQIESVEFMKKHITVLPENGESQLHLLCDLLGNLPLAIQIAISTLNRQKFVNLETYIDRIKNTPEILHTTFDKYEHTIYKTMQISLDLIQHHESNDDRKIGEIALRILSIFGFIIPDNVESKFFMAVETKRLTLLKKIKSTLFNVKYQTVIFSKDEINEAMNVLQVYSLVAINNIPEGEYTLSIHRLLQQVIRHNFKNSEEEILTQILNCDEFLEYKLIPFSYANKKLQKKFPKIKAELIDKLKLSQLMRERRFKEAVELSRIITNTLKNPVSQYNFAVCLKHNNEWTQCENLLENLLDQIDGQKNKPTINEYFTNCKLEIIESINQLNKTIVMSQLFSTYIYNKNVQRGKNFVLKWKHVTLPMIPLIDVINFLNLMSMPNLFLERLENKNCITVRDNNINECTMQMELHFRVLDANTQFHVDLQDLVLVKYKISASNNPFVMTKNVTSCHVNIGYKLCAENDLVASLLHAEDFVDFTKVKKMMFKNMQIEFRSNMRPQENVSRKKSPHIFEWEKDTWMTNNWFVCHLDLAQKNTFTLTDITMEHCSVDISFLPPVLKKLTLQECFLINCFKSNSVAEESQQNCLEELSLINIFVKDMEHGEQCTPFDISHFLTPMLKKLTVNNFACECVSLFVSVNRLTSIQSLHLAECALVLDGNICIAPTELTLKNVRMVDTRQRILHHIIVNEFVNFNQMNFLCLTGMSINFSEPVSMKELILRNSNTINWEWGCWILEKVRMTPSSGRTDMKIDQLVIMEDEDDANNSSVQSRKDELLKYFKSISGYKTIFGLFDDRDGATANTGFETFQSLFKTSPGIWSTIMPECSADTLEWQSFVHHIISNWNSGHLVHIRWKYEEHPLMSVDITLKKIVWKDVLDTIAPYLQELQTAGVVAICDLLPRINTTVGLWRDYWPNDKIKLYQMTRDYLTQHHGLSSIIFVWSIDAEWDMTEWKKYWPGDNYVDVVSVISSEQLSHNMYKQLLEIVGEKPISLEGIYYVSTPQLLVGQSRWTWFTIRSINLLQRSNYVIKTKKYENIEAIFNSPSVITRGSHEMFKTLN